MTGLKEALTMTGTEANVAVTLSTGLYRKMRLEARRLGVPIEWLVASLVADTVDHNAAESNQVVAA